MTTMVQLVSGITGNECFRSKADAKSQEENNQIDMELVRRVREKLRAEYESNKDQYAGSNHYLEIMDPKSAHTCWRFLNEKAGNVDEALELMKKAIVWRLESEADQEIDYTKMAVKEFFHMAPSKFSGSDKDGRDVLYVVGRDYHKPDAIFRKYVIRFFQNQFIEWDRKNRYNLNQLVVVFDATDTGYRSMDLELMSWLIGVIDYLPSRIHQIYVVGVNFIIRPIVRLIISWCPAKLSSRVLCGTFEELVEQNIDPENYPDRVGGSAPDTIHLAPIETPWLEQSTELNNPKMIDRIEYCIGFYMPQERRNELKAMQIEYEQNNKHN